MSTPTAAYEINAKWAIVRANDAFCRLFLVTPQGLIGRDVRDLLRRDWQLDFRTYVAQAMVGVGDTDVTIPMVAPCGEEGWFKHSLEPIMADGLLTGYRATVAPHLAVASAEPAQPWWQPHAQAPHHVWDAELSAA